MRETSSPSSLLITAFNGLVAAYDRADGATQWTFTVPGKSVPGARSRPTHAEAHDGWVFVLAGGSEGTLKKRVFIEVHALDYLTGQPLWTQRVEGSPTPTFAGGSMLVENGQVIVAYYDVLAAFAADSGALQWSRSSEHGGGGLHMPQLQLGVPGTRARQLL
ncbi:outer membrane protein assembly factor BamB family protein [Myxococcus landrumensis]|uniref:PQQ-binding-like beta-propeller repeat protein n=1 Tax=Myxococcus landrumensis TaxID=2813577 RepID=A0ABX7NAL5_9BACT|nr:PQQ-binding-like beta-propeller repeat protein [Myxococcus landrumus]QSQ15693.1 PQQ-binding-like beta-propeller repeat protein [Myxococcus landrumus]